MALSWGLRVAVDSGAGVGPAVGPNAEAAVGIGVGPIVAGGAPSAMRATGVTGTGAGEFSATQATKVRAAAAKRKPNQRAPTLFIDIIGFGMHPVENLSRGPGYQQFWGPYVGADKTAVAAFTI